MNLSYRKADTCRRLLSWSLQEAIKGNLCKVHCSMLFTNRWDYGESQAIAHHLKLTKQPLIMVSICLTVTVSLGRSLDLMAAASGEVTPQPEEQAKYLIISWNGSVSAYLFILIHNLTASQCWIRIFTIFPNQDSCVHWVCSAYPLYHMLIRNVIFGQKSPRK